MTTLACASNTIESTEQISGTSACGSPADRHHGLHFSRVLCLGGHVSTSEHPESVSLGLFWGRGGRMWLGLPADALAGRGARICVEARLSSMPEVPSRFKWTRPQRSLPGVRNDVRLQRATRNLERAASDVGRAGLERVKRWATLTFRSSPCTQAVGGCLPASMP